MVNTRNSAKDKASGVTDKPKNFNGDNEGGDPASFVPDGLLTGRYYVAGVRYIYDPMEEFKFKTEFDLCRINWLSENIID
jgi:hypothetical protein